ncbi:MAG TPA: hypothetical protein VL899_17405 [Alphaproteobacteria bacterium]|jgi:hypothetical protein|nr:hypothetical protein [Alphaproteobacteria bacterium]
MKIVAAALPIIMLAAMPAKAQTLLDGTFNGSFSCPKYQGITNALVTFTVTGTRIRSLMTIYHSQNSKYGFATSVLDYTGYYNAAKRTFQLTGYNTVGMEPRDWTYDQNIHGSLDTTGTKVTMQGNIACTTLYAQRVTQTSALKK